MDGLQQTQPRTHRRRDLRGRRSMYKKQETAVQHPLMERINLCFLLSGFCSLLYQTVWLRMAVARFGVNAPIIASSTFCFHAWPRPRKSSWVKISGLSEHHEIPDRPSGLRSAGTGRFHRRTAGAGDDVLRCFRDSVSSHDQWGILRPLLSDHPYCARSLLCCDGSHLSGGLVFLWKF